MSKRTITLLLMAATALATVAALGVAVAQTDPDCDTATVLAGSNFEIDTTVPPGANLKVDDPQCIDWLNAGGNTFRSGVEVKNDTQSGATDESFGQGTAEDIPNPTLVDGSIPPNKSDLKAFGVFQEGDEFLELFWSRVQVPKGTTNMDFELNQNKCEHTDDDDNNPELPDYNDDADPDTFDDPTTESVCANNGPNTDPTSIQVTPERTDGDKLVAYDLSKGGDDPTITIHTWVDVNGTVDDADHWDEGTCLVAPAGVECEGGGTDAAGSVNTLGLPASETGGLGAQDAYTFGEAAVSFEALFGGEACGEFGSAYLKSRSSDSFTSEIKDFVPPKAVQIGNCSTSLTTDASNNGTESDPAQTVGGSISDQATLGADVPADTDGEVVFRLYKFALDATITETSCTADNQVTTYATDGTSNVPVVNHNVPGDGNTSNPYTSASFTTSEVGKYQWTAEFVPAAGQGLDPSGEIGCGQAVEQSTVNPVSPGLTTNATTPVTIGSSIKDTATLSGATSNATGTINFKLYGPFSGDPSQDQCTADKLVFETVPSPGTPTDVPIGSPNEQGNYVVESPSYTPTAAGRYQWVASYSGDANNQAKASECRAANEASVVNPASPGLTTNATTPVTIGSSIKDTATLSGATSNATGTINFKLYGPFLGNDPTQDQCTADKLVFETVPSPGTPADVPIGSPNGQGDYVVESPEFTPTDAGRYQWVASYSGDNNNNAKTSECRAENEASVVNPRAPELTTNATTPVTIDDPISDTATLTGATNDAIGTITFKLYGPFDPDTPASGDTCDDTTLVTTLGPVDIGSPNANGDYVVSSGDYTPTEVGRYQWIASYSGDANNGAVTGNCGEANEASVVNKAPANIETAQELFPQDSATLSATAGGTPTGTVDFALYGPNDANCSGTAVYTEENVDLTSGVANTDNTSFSVDQADSGNYKWIVHYDGDATHDEATSACGKEAFTATIDDDTTN